MCAHIWKWKARTHTHTTLFLELRTYSQLLLELSTFCQLFSELTSLSHSAAVPRPILSGQQPVRGVCELEQLLPAERAAEGVRPDWRRTAPLQWPRHHPLYPEDRGQKWVSCPHFSVHKELGFPAFQDARSEKVTRRCSWVKWPLTEKWLLCVDLPGALRL